MSFYILFLLYFYCAGTKEQSFVYALSSAALTYTMAKACSSGALFSCTCAQPPRERPNGNFKWGGCSDNLKWASRFVRQFAENAKKNKGPKTTPIPEEGKKELHIPTTTELSPNELILKFNVSEVDTGSSETKFRLAHEVATLVKRDVIEHGNKYKKGVGQITKRTKVLNKELLDKKLQKLQPYIDVVNVQNSRAGRKVSTYFLSCKFVWVGAEGGGLIYGIQTQSRKLNISTYVSTSLNSTNKIKYYF